MSWGVGILRRIRDLRVRGAGSDRLLGEGRCAVRCSCAFLVHAAVADGGAAVEGYMAAWNKAVADGVFEPDTDGD